MSQYTLIATSAFGIESLVARELRSLGFDSLRVDNGKITFKGDETDILRSNLHLRIADRILIKMAEFKATDFEALYQGVYAIPWENLIPENGKMHIVGKSHASTLFSVSDCQAITKKAVIESMKRKYPRSWFKEDGPVYKIEVALVKDLVTITIDTTGPGLHKRGYRLEQGDAPLRETLAAALVQLSRWDASRILADPFCGSGTIPIEAAMIARKIAPGSRRSFAVESWPNFPQKLVTQIREEVDATHLDIPITIYASDLNKKAIQIAKDNAERAGVMDNIIFQKKPLQEFSSKKKYGCIICNPPYGERIGKKQDLHMLYRDMGICFQALPEWSYFILTAFEEFEKYFGIKAHKNRKLYNGKLKCYLHQYLGSLPPRENLH
jgi:putative N6-adenine-specific DNA methylase